MTLRPAMWGWKTRRPRHSRAVGAASAATIVDHNCRSQSQMPPSPLPAGQRAENAAREGEGRCRAGVAFWDRLVLSSDQAMLSLAARASYFSLLVQRKSNQKKAHPASRPALCAGFAVCAGFFEGPSLAHRKTRGLLPRALRAWPAQSAVPRGRKIKGVAFGKLALA